MQDIFEGKQEIKQHEKETHKDQLNVYSTEWFLNYILYSKSASQQMYVK